jgi:hypothetical protein
MQINPLYVHGFKPAQISFKGLAQLIEKDSAMYGEIVKKANIKVN